MTKATPQLLADTGKSRRSLLFACAAVLIVGLGVFVAPGSTDAGDSLIVLIQRLLYAGPAALAYLVGGVGLGRLARPLFRGAKDPLALQVGVGLGLMLFLSHLLGVLGVLGIPAVSMGVVGVGFVLAAHQLVMSLRGSGWEPSVSPVGLVSAVGVAILLVAACNPPGALWGSEYGGYDVLEYHLQLPQEWLLAGRVSPVSHNVYSYLPSYLESAYTHLGAMTTAPTSGQPPLGLLAGDGDRLISCQLLHAGFALLAAWMTLRLAARLVDFGALGRGLVFALVLLTPWTVVTGSMAYNEMALVTFFAAAALGAVETDLAPWKRGLVVGLLVGVASSVKPTGLLFVGVPVGVLLLGMARPRQWWILVGAGSGAGLLMLAPWLIRNFHASGNPVFPFAAGLFPNAQQGTGAWSADQVARYTGAHQFHGTLTDRLRLLVMPEAGAAANGGPSAQRGMMHPQWGLLFPFTLMAGAWLAWRGAGRKEGEARVERGVALLGAGVVLQVVLWLFTTHLQSRFLMPLVVPCAVVCGAAAASMIQGLKQAKVALSLVISLVWPLTQAVFLVTTFISERGGKPNVSLAYGPAYSTGQLHRGLSPEALGRMLAVASPDVFVNVAMPPDARIFLLGDATPLYVTRPVIYQTTYDTSPLSGVPVEKWSAVFRELNVKVVLVNIAEVARLERSGWNWPGVTVRAAGEWVGKYSLPIRQPQGWAEKGLFIVSVPETDAPAAMKDGAP